MNKPLKPGVNFPDLKLVLLGSTRQRLTSFLSDTNGFLLIAYRGMQCGHCKEQLSTFDHSFDELTMRGIRAVAVSMDTEERALQTQRELALHSLPIAHGLTENEARACGLYLSSARKESEMPLFCEPGLFLIRPTGVLEASWVSTFAFPRPAIGAILKAIDLISSVDSSLPPRGGQ